MPQTWCLTLWQVIIRPLVIPLEIFGEAHEGSGCARPGIDSLPCDKRCERWPTETCMPAHAGDPELDDAHCRLRIRVGSRFRAAKATGVLTQSIHSFTWHPGISN